MMITIDKLARAIEKRLGHPRAEAFAQAHRVMDYFGFRTLITDNTIPPDDRRLFYALYDVGLLRSSGETVLLTSGRTWRIFYWELVEADLDGVLREPPLSAKPLYATPEVSIG